MYVCVCVFVCRLQEKQEEVRTLKSALEAEHLRVSASVREAEDAKAELRQRTAALDQLRSEMTSVEVMKVELRGSREEAQRDHAERAQLAARIEVLTDSLEAAKRVNRDLERNNNSLEGELLRMREDQAGAQKSLYSSGEVARENERLKLSSASLRDEVKELSSLSQSLQSECKAAKDHSERLKAALDASDAHGRAVDSQLLHESSARAAAEASLSELRLWAERASADLEAERTARVEGDRSAREGIERLDALRVDIGERCCCFVCCFVLFSSL